MQNGFFCFNNKNKQLRSEVVGIQKLGILNVELLKVQELGQMEGTTRDLGIGDNDDDNDYESHSEESMILEKRD